MARVAIAQEVWIKWAARIGGNTFEDQAIVGSSKGSGSRARTAGNKKPRLEAGFYRVVAGVGFEPTTFRL